MNVWTSETDKGMFDGFQWDTLRNEIIKEMQKNLLHKCRRTLDYEDIVRFDWRNPFQIGWVQRSVIKYIYTAHLRLNLWINTGF